MEKPLVKVCGMADAGNMREVAALGPDLMGFIFYRPSPRNAFGLSPEAVRSLHPNIKRVGVFVDEKSETITATAGRYGLTHLQLHGGESPEMCSSLRDKGYTVIKAFGIKEAQDLAASGSYEGCCDYFLFDTKTPLKGGSGVKFDHSILDAYTGPTPYLISGGIGPGDTEITGTGPLYAGVDVNSRFETSPGIKDTAQLETFIKSIKKTYEQDRQTIRD